MATFIVWFEDTNPVKIQHLNQVNIQMLENYIINICQQTKCFLTLKLLAVA